MKHEVEKKRWREGKGKTVKENLERGIKDREEEWAEKNGVGKGGS